MGNSWAQLWASATVGLVIFILAQAYGFVASPTHTDPLVAPQANAMAAVIEPLMLQGAQVHWTLYAVGAILSLLMTWIGISPLAFALGMFIPLDLNTPLASWRFVSPLLRQERQKRRSIRKSTQSTRYSYCIRLYRRCSIVWRSWCVLVVLQR